MIEMSWWGSLEVKIFLFFYGGIYVSIYLGTTTRERVYVPHILLTKSHLLWSEKNRPVSYQEHRFFPRNHRIHFHELTAPLVKTNQVDPVSPEGFGLTADGVDVFKASQLPERIIASFFST